MNKEALAPWIFFLRNQNMNFFPLWMVVMWTVLFSLSTYSNWGWDGKGKEVVIAQVQFSSFQSLSHHLCDPMNHSTPGLPVHHQLPEFTQTHVHWVGDAIQPSHLLLSTSPPSFHLSQHQGLLKWVCSLHQVAKVLEFQLQHQSFQWIFRTDFLWLIWSLCSPRDSQESSPTPQFKTTSSSVLSFLYSPTLTSKHDHWKKHSLD